MPVPSFGEVTVVFGVDGVEASADSLVRMVMLRK